MTQNDLSQIKQVIENVVEQKLEEKLEQKLEEKLKPINQRLDSIGEVIDNKLDKALKPIHKKLDKLTRDLKDTTRFLDTEILETKQRVDHIEKHLGLSHRYSLQS